MATLFRVQCALGRSSNIPRDDSINTWHFYSAALDPQDDIDEIKTELETFYTAIDNWFSAILNGTVDIKFYDLTDDVPRVPVDVDDFAISPGAGAPLPAEVAICMSFHGAQVSGVANGRRRGRLYLGPLGANVLDDNTVDAAVTSTARGDICDAASALQAAGEGSSWVWTIFSPTTAGAPPWDLDTLGASKFDVIGGHVDNAFDTMRSRGVLANTRTTWGS